MKKNWVLMSVAVLALAACSEAGDQTGSYGDVAYDAETSAEMAAEITENDADSSAIPELADIPITMPQLAYTYDYRWRLPSEEIGSLQRRHATLCEQQGPGACQILGMSKTGEEAGNVSGVLQMAVASRQARAFGALLDDEAQDAGAEQVAAEIASEELSKRIVDTEARLRARTELRDRLMEALETRNGTVEELVEAERSVARVNEEIDQARSWLAEMEGRVAYSRVTVHYETGMPISNDFLSPVEGAVGALGSILGYVVAALILIGSVALPLGLVIWGIRAGRRRFAPLPDTASEAAT